MACDFPKWCGGFNYKLLYSIYLLTHNNTEVITGHTADNSEFYTNMTGRSEINSINRRRQDRQTDVWCFLLTHGINEILLQYQCTGVYLSDSSLVSILMNPAQLMNTFGPMRTWDNVTSWVRFSSLLLFCFNVYIAHMLTTSGPVQQSNVSLSMQWVTVRSDNQQYCYCI